uniref:integrator complex subunit 1-like n=1 Tax=Styela clava TaxID=7725 RepID=UPI00193AA738|nr:integrator complex subunit 1-like [Styela clava]
MKRTTSGPPKRLRPGPPADLIALGKSKTELQRAAPEPSLPSIKKVSTFHTIAAATSSHQSRMSPTIPEPSVKYIDAAAQDLLKKVTEAKDQETVDGLVCGAIRVLRANRLRPDQVIVYTLMVLAKKQPSIFTSEMVVECLVGLLKKDVGLEYIKSKGNSISAVLACNLLFTGFEQNYSWPSLLVKVFIEDSLSDRIWVDHPKCKKFVSSVSTAFDTVQISKEHKVDTGEDVDMKEKDESSEDEQNVSKRFMASAELVRLYAIDMVRERVNRRQGTISAQDPTGAASGRHLIKTLIAMCGISEIRVIAAHKLEMWSQNPKLAKSTQDLLMSICVNCRDHNQDDVDVISCLVKMRLKTKALLNHYIQCLKILIDAHKDSINTLFSYIIYNELSSARNPTNMSVIAALLQHKPKIAAETLAIVCQDLLLQKEDYLRAVRALVREIVRIAKHDVQFTSFALGIMKEPDREKFMHLDQAHKERFVSSTADLVCLLMLVSISPTVKEAIGVITKKATPTSEVDHDTIFHGHKLDLAAMQRDAVWWLHATAVPLLLPKITTPDLGQHIHKLLFLKSAETYYMKDNWPPESERAMMVKHCAEVPLLEDTIMRLAVIGLSHEHPIAPAETLELIGQLVHRAGALAKPHFNPIPVERRDVIDTLLSLAQYHHPENIHLPSDYVPPSLAISLLYWSIWQTLLIISSFNPSSIGLQAWNEYPILRSFMEMAIINNFTFPLATVVEENERSQIVNKEMQMVEMEKNEIIEFESHLAAATTHLAVTEETSLLLSQLIAMDTKGPPRRPPEHILNKTRLICSQIQVGAGLCRSRNPDFLLYIINRHGEDQAMPWLSSLVGSAKGDMSMLPVQCLCEYLMASSVDDSKAENKLIQEKEIVAQLQNSLRNQQTEESWQPINYFLRRLHSPQYETRLRAKHALSLVLRDEDMDTNDPKICHVQPVLEDYEWLLYQLVSLPNYNFVHSKAVDAITETIKWDSDESMVTACLAFLADDITKLDLSLEDSAQSVSRFALSTAHLLIDRQVLVRNILSDTIKKSGSSGKTIANIFVESILKIFLCHMNLIKKQHSSDGTDHEETMEQVPWCDTQDEIFLRWPRGSGHAQMHILVSQAMILLLTCGRPKQKRGNADSLEGNKMYQEVLQTWFAEDGSTIPKAFLMDTQEEALLLPDWLRLRLLHCEVNATDARLPIAGSRDLDLEQLLLFIQSFGIPYQSMDRLLGSLDEFCSSTPEAVANSVKDNRSYLAKLVEGQWKRGCCNGTDFHALLSMEKLSPRPSVIQSASATITDVVDLTVDQSEDSDIIMVSSPEKATSSQEEDENLSMLVDDSVTNMLQDLFMANGNDVIKYKMKKNLIFRNLMRSINLRKMKNSNGVVNCVSEMYALVSAKKTGLVFLNGLYMNTNWSCSLIRKIDSSLKRAKSCSNLSQRKIIDSSIEVFEKLVLILKVKAPSSLSSENHLLLLLQSWACSEKKQQAESEGLGQLDWARLEEFLRKQLAFLERDEEIKNKVALVAKILLEEIGNRKSKASRGKCDVQDDAFYASIGTTGLLIDWLQLLDPELLAHRPKLQRKLLFESQRLVTLSMPIKMSAKMSNIKLPQSLTSHQTYLLSLLAEHSNWETVYKCLQWLLSDSTYETSTEKSGKSQSSGINVDARTAMDFLWVCMHMSNIWKGRENKSTSLQEPVFYLNSEQFCRVLSYMVASSTKQASSTLKSGWGGTSYFELFLVFYTRFGQKVMRSENLEKTVMFVYSKAKENAVDLWWQLLAQLYILQPFHDVWNTTNSQCNEGIEQNYTLAKAVTSSEVGSICRLDSLVQMLLDRIGYVKETGRVDARDSVTAIQSSVDSAYDASLILKKLASCCPAIVLRQLSLMLITLSGRTWYEFREFKAKNHLLFMSQLLGILDSIGHQLFDNDYANDVDKIIDTYLQMCSNYCTKARRQLRDVMHNTLQIVYLFLQKKPQRAHRIVYQYMYMLQGLMDHTYSDHDYVVSLIRKIMNTVESAPLMMNTYNAETEEPVNDDILIIDTEISDANEQATPYLRILAKSDDLENIAQVLAELSDTKRKITNLEPFLPHFTKLFTTCRESSIRHAALSASIVCMRASPSRSCPQILPAYLSCLTGIKTPLVSTSSQTRLYELGETTAVTGTNSDELAQTALDFLPDVVVLCRERAAKILEAAFACGSRGGVGIQPPGPQGLLGTPVAIGGKSTWQDLSELLAKSVTLLSGLAQSNVKPAPSGQS